MTSGTLAEEVKAETERLLTHFRKEYVYTVYSFGEQSGNGYNVMASTNRTEANDYAQLYRGVVTQQEIIADYREPTTRAHSTCVEATGAQELKAGTRSYICGPDCPA